MNKKPYLFAIVPALVLGTTQIVLAGECGDPCTVTSTSPEINLIDTTPADESWEIEANDTRGLEIAQNGAINGSGVLRILPGADAQQLVLADNSNTGLNTAAPQSSNELEVAGNNGSGDTFAAVAVSPGGPSDDSARFSVNDSSDTLTLGVRTGAGGYNNPVAIDLDAGNNEIAVTAQGRVGLGGKTIQQVNSASQLHVAGSGSTSGNVFLDDVGSAGDWLIDPGTSGLWLRNGSTTGSPAPVKFSNGAPVNSLVMDNTGKLGVGTDIPANPVHVEKGDGTAQVKVKELSAGNTLRTLFNLICDQCTPAFRFQQASLIWFFRMLQTGDFAVDFQGSPGNEFIFAQNGNLTIQGVVNSGSSRATKHAIEEVDPKTVLQKVAALPVSEWSYKTDKEGVRHTGPMAEDFHAAFGLGESDKSISTIDTGGVALAAIQGLNQVVQEKEGEIRQLKQRLGEMEGQQERLAKLEAMVNRMAARDQVALLNQ